MGKPTNEEERVRRLIASSRDFVALSKSQRGFFEFKTRKAEKELTKAADDMEASLNSGDAISVRRLVRRLWLAYLALLAHLGIVASIYGSEIRSFLERFVTTVSTPDYRAALPGGAVLRVIVSAVRARRRKGAPDLAEAAHKVDEAFEAFGFALGPDRHLETLSRSWEAADQVD